MSQPARPTTPGVGGLARAGAIARRAAVSRPDIGAGRRCPPIGFTGDSRAALRHHRRRADGPVRPTVRSRCPTACPTEVTVERPRQKGHGDYATNVALQLAKQAGHQPARASPAGRRRSSPTPTGIAAVEIAGPGFLNITVEAAGARAQLAARSSRPGAAYGTHRRVRRREGQPGVRLGQPHRAAPPRRHPLGRGRRRARPGPRACRRRGHPRSTTSTTPAPRSTASATRCWPAPRASRVPEDGYGGAYIADIATDGRWPSTRHRSTCPRTSALTVFRDGGVELDVRRDQAEPATTSASTSTSGSTSRTCTRAGAVAAGRRRGSRSRATSTRPTARSGCAPPTSATTRTG